MSDEREIIIDRLDVFNARDLTASQVADNFVEPRIYKKICEGLNTLLIGPRGSGKTTLLKMLTPEGRERRRHGSESSDEPSFSGVYIPIDVQLADRLDSISTAGLEPAISEVVATSLYAFHVFRCVTETLAWHCTSSRRHSAHHTLTRTQEAEAVQALADLWGISLNVPTISALQSGLRTRHSRALELWSRQVFRLHTGREVEVDSLDCLDFDSGLKGAVDVLSNATSWNSGHRWAILFDEVEIAPEILQRHLLSYLRTSDQSILFKIAIAPYMQAYRGLPDRTRASALNDFNVINLQDDHDNDHVAFTAAYFQRACDIRFGKPISIDAALGPSILASDTGSTDAELSYGPRSPQVRRFRNLYRKDASFAQYMDSLGVDAESLISSGDSHERAPFRKVRQVALVREAYLSEPGSGRRLATRNSPGRLYVGAGGVTRMCEGNPRRLAFVTPMLLAGMDTGTLRVPFQVQTDAVGRTEAAFRSFLRGLPISEELGSTLPRGLLSFVDLLGSWFHDQIMAADFDIDPVGSFIVDSNASESTEELIARGLNSGAFVQLSDNDNSPSQRSASAFEPLTNSRGKRFRLSYLLSLNYGLTLRVGRAISLRTIMQRAAEKSSSNHRRISDNLLKDQERLW
ncbi:hypothetical protein SAMN04488581_2335 [Mycolicibacterium neoaurum]|uniref:ORC-CDC6 family AAA ATPase n=1 Tax=Mycolicibacterium neoaurum TaxID=1795 RepID=UPI00088122F7|nr:hypothetical protein [Mycolicibacterium neoaurum]SDD46670.1 hypothetical protein SAMN04488581_2335 [Mycolicibacterium neoaurum]